MFHGCKTLFWEKVLVVKSILGSTNPADIATKHLSAKRLDPLMYLFGIWSGSKAQVAGQDDPSSIFKHFPHQHQAHAQRNPQIQLLLGALSLLAIQLQSCAPQIHFCSSFPFAMMDVVFDVPTIAVTTWVGVLGPYIWCFFAVKWIAVRDQQGAS